MKKTVNFLKRPLILTMLSAFLSGLSFSHYSLSFLLWVSFIPLFYALISFPSKRWIFAALRGVMFGFLYYVMIYYWFLSMHPLSYAGLYGGASIAVVLLAWLGISFVHGVLFCIPALFVHFARRLINSPLFLGLLAIFGILIAEKLTSVSELAFPWVRIALPLYRAPVLLQAVSLFGMDGIDTLILLFNLLLALIFMYPFQRKRVFALAAAVLFSANLIFGIFRMNIVSKGKEVKVLCIQGNIGTDEKWSDTDQSISDCYDKYISLTKENADDDTDLVVWPESAVPINLSSYSHYVDGYKALSSEISTPILMGTLWSDNGQNVNTATYFDGDEIKKPYIKRNNVPFGEYMPYRKLLSRLFPSLAKINVLGRDYKKGTDTNIIASDIGALGNVICLEITHPNLSRASVRDGAQLMFAVTNDSWLKDSRGVWQHEAHTVFRSIENSRCYVRAANSGVTAITDSRGRIISEIGPLKEGVLKQDVYLSNEKTLYTMFGDLFFPLLFALILSIGIALKIKQRREP